MNRPDASPEILGFVRSEYETILTPEALTFVKELCESFTHRVKELLARRREGQARLDAESGKLNETAYSRTKRVCRDPSPVQGRFKGASKAGKMSLRLRARTITPVPQA